MRNLLTPTLPLLAVLALSGCGQSEETVNQTIADPMEQELQNAAPVELPPPLKLSETYRCKDNSLVSVDFFVGDTQANIRSGEGAAPVRLTAPAAGEPFEAEGFKVEGSGDSVTITTPEKGTQVCKA